MRPTTALRNTIRRLGTALVALSLAVAIAGPTLARELVDQTTLNPQPPDFFNAACYRTGAQIICDLAFSDPNITDEPSGIVCGGTELLFSQARSVVGKRFYSADGNLTRRHFREALAGTLTNPTTGKVITWDQHDTVLHNLSVPGDLASGTIQVTGLVSRFVMSSGRTVLVDSGTTLIDAATDVILRAGEHHPLDAYFRFGDAAAVQPLCDALA